MDFSNISNNWLQNGFTLETNLSEVKGNGLIELMESLNYFSMEISNMRIIERIMYQHPFAFRTQESIKEIMRKSDPVINAFATMGNCDRNCNIKWLVKELNKLREFKPLRNIVATGPPSIKMRCEKRIRSGCTIIFEISTISVAKVQWRKHYHGQEEIVLDHLRVHEYTTAQLSYTTKENDKGYFYAEVTCKGGFRNCTQWIYVGDDEDIETDLPSSSIHSPITPNPEVTEITASPESDGIKRLALLIGIMNYNKNSQKLKAPETDICDLERILLKLGFTVYCFGDLNTEQMRTVLNQFSNLYEEDKTNIFFYFAGHGARKEMRDHLELIDNKMPIRDVLEYLTKKKPKMVVSMFDMCRDNNNEGITDKRVLEAKVPFEENLMVVMSTLPTRKAYETPNGCENTSLIMKPLCDTLSKYGSKWKITHLIAHFITSCENIEQRPTLSGVGINEILGIDILIPRLKPRLVWSKIPKNQEIMQSITIDSNIFHNFINIYINKTVRTEDLKPSIYLSNDLIKIDEGGNAKIDLFKYKENLKMSDDGFIKIDYKIFQESVMNKYPIKIFIPKDIISFL